MDNLVLGRWWIWCWLFLLTLFVHDCLVIRSGISLSDSHLPPAKKADPSSESDSTAAWAVLLFFGELFFTSFTGLGHLSLKWPFSPQFQHTPWSLHSRFTLPLDDADIALSLSSAFMDFAAKCLEHWEILWSCSSEINAINWSGLIICVVECSCICKQTQCKVGEVIGNGSGNGGAVILVIDNNTISGLASPSQPIVHPKTHECCPCQRALQVHKMRMSLTIRSHWSFREVFMCTQIKV